MKEHILYDSIYIKHKTGKAVLCCSESGGPLFWAWCLEGTRWAPRDCEGYVSLSGADFTSVFSL